MCIGQAPVQKLYNRLIVTVLCSCIACQSPNTDHVTLSIGIGTGYSYH